MKKLIIVGAGGFGREIFSWACKLQATENFSEIKGFIDDNIGALQHYNYNITDNRRDSRLQAPKRRVLCNGDCCTCTEET